MRKVLNNDLLAGKTPSNVAAVVVTIIAVKFCNRSINDVVKDLKKTKATILRLYRQLEPEFPNILPCQSKPQTLNIPKKKSGVKLFFQNISQKVQQGGDLPVIQELANTDKVNILQIIK